MEPQAGARKALFVCPKLIENNTTSISKDILNILQMKKIMLNVDEKCESKDNGQNCTKWQDQILPGILLGQDNPLMVPTDPIPAIRPSYHAFGQLNLRPVSEIPETFRTVFSSSFEYFNQVQSVCLDDLLYTDKIVVVSAPTGSGKTALFELTIIRSLETMGLDSKIVYMAPVKALCAERYRDWSEKFAPCGLRLTELTGDSESDDFLTISQNNLIITTPEKWDAVSRRWRDKKHIANSIKLFLIDEVHLLNDKDRGHVLETVVSRMKTIGVSPRFVAVSATIPNLDDIAHWLGGKNSVYFKFGEDLRPVKLDRIVLGFPFYNGQSEFKFEMNLSYKLPNIIYDYSDNKPTLIFCNSRKATIYTCSILAKNLLARITGETKNQLMALASNITDVKLRGFIEKGIGYHHAGLERVDRAVVEKMFSAGILPVLACTSTLAMGVNLPAHLVIIKSTRQMISGIFREYSESQILQMAGRAGRPQFDTTATVVIMTEESRKRHYHNLICGTQLIESNLHQHLHEHLNAEVVLENIKTIVMAVEWLKASFWYVRVKRNPSHYSLPVGLSNEQIEKKMYEICFEALNSLADKGVGLVKLEESCVLPTDSGRLMSRFYMAFDTMRRLATVKGNESIPELLDVICGCKEFSDITLRTSEKAALNNLNSNKEKAGVRFPLTGKIKDATMKVNILLQASLGCLPISDPGLTRETPRCIQLATRMAKCLLEVVRNNKSLNDKICILKSSVLLCKSLHCGIWDNSPFVSKQMDRIGMVLSKALVQSGFNTFQRISAAIPASLEMAMNKYPPFGTYVRDFASQMPVYQVKIVQQGLHTNTATLQICIHVLNLNNYRKKGASMHEHRWFLIVEGSRNVAIDNFKGSDSFLMNEKSSWIRHIKVHPQDCYQGNVTFSLISETISGIDITSSFMPTFLNQSNKTKESVSLSMNSALDEHLPSLPNGRRVCKHNCSDKASCAHICCKSGVAKKKTGFIEEINKIASTYKQKSIAGYFEYTPKRARLGMSPNQMHTINQKSNFDQHEVIGLYGDINSKKRFQNDEADFDILPHNSSFTDELNENELSCTSHLNYEHLIKENPLILDRESKSAALKKDDTLSLKSTSENKRTNFSNESVPQANSVHQFSSTYLTPDKPQMTHQQDKSLSDYFRIQKIQKKDIQNEEHIDILFERCKTTSSLLLTKKEFVNKHEVDRKTSELKSEVIQDPKKTFCDIFSGMF